jgi:hypothetical protein
MNVDIGAEATLFPEKEYISGIFVAVHCAQLAGQWGQRNRNSVRLVKNILY